jgi:uncharacterized membrane protein YqjE
MAAPEGAPSGLVASLRQLLHSALALAFTRVELLAVEWEEERRRLTSALVLVLMAVTLASMALVMLSLAIVLACPEAQRGWAALGLALLYAAGTLGLLWRLRRWLRAWQPFAGTLGELRKDAVALKDPT